MRYMLTVEVKLQEMPDEPTIPTVRAGDDPIQGMTGVLTAIAAPLRTGPGFMYGQLAGFDFRKQVSVSTPDFQGLADIIGRFDNLVSDIAAEKLQV